MSADTVTQAERARATKSLIKGAGARLAGRKRGPDRRVRRLSVDVGDRRALVFRPIHGGDRKAGMRWRDTILRVARELDVVGKQKGRWGPLGPHTREVFRALLELVDFSTGRLEPTYAKLMEMTGYARSTISSALRRLRVHGFVDWVRRSHVVETDDGEIAREQTSNAYFFDFGRLARPVRLRFQQLLGRRDRAAAAAIATTVQPERADAPLSPRDPELAAVLASIQAALDRGAE